MLDLNSLDKRIKDKTMILTQFSDATEFIGQKGFFANSLIAFKDLRLTTYGKLESAETGFEIRHKLRDNETFEFFIPEAFVDNSDLKEPETLDPEEIEEELESLNERVKDIEVDFPDVCEAISEFKDNFADVFERLRVLENILRLHLKGFDEEKESIRSELFR